MNSGASCHWEEAGAMEGLWCLWSRQRGMDNEKRKESLMVRRRTKQLSRDGEDIQHEAQEVK